MRSKNKAFTVRTGFDATIGGIDVCIEFDRVTSFDTDPNYGADADGNRGMSMTSIDEDAAENIVVSWDDDKDTYDNVPVADLPEARRTDVQALVDAYLEKNDPEVPEGDEDGPDDDR